MWFQVCSGEFLGGVLSGVSRFRGVLRSVLGGVVRCVRRRVLGGVSMRVLRCALTGVLTGMCCKG